MIEGIVQIGRALTKEGNLLDTLIREVPVKDKKDKPLLIMKLNFKKDSLDIDIKEEMDNESVKKYIHVGSADVPTSPQWFATSKNINYFLTETLYNLTNIDFGDNLNKKIKYVFDNFYIKIDENIKSVKYQYALDMERYLDKELDVKNIYLNMKGQGKNDKEITKELSKAFEVYIKEKYDIKLSEVGLFTILIDGIPLSSFKEYQEKVLEAKKAGGQEEDNNLLCFICGSKNNVTSDVAKMKIKYYTTNQIIFASEIDAKNYYKNMALCQDCLNSIIASEVYMDNNLKTKIGDLTAYIIPHFIYGEPLDKEELDFIVKKINKSLNIAKNLKAIESFEYDMLNFLELKEERTYYVLNFMFVKQSNQSTKIQRFIKDVPPNIFEKIAKASKYSYDVMKKSFYKYNSRIDLLNIYYTIPIKVKKGEVVEYRDILSLYDSIFTQRPVDKLHIIDKFIDGVNVIRLNKEGYNLKTEEICYYILKSNMMIKFLEKLKCLKEGKALDTSCLNVKEEIKQYIKDMGYDEQQTAMFLLGILIGEIGNSQYKRYDGNKPILNKLNFNGIDKSKIIRLSNEVYTKLEQEKIRNFNEVLYSDFKKLLDSNMNKWMLNKNENLYYILSGYSYATAKPMLKEVNENE
ncbi:TIGR02556 family CRISPR-associated protein [Caloramator sp. E03]|uniref:TIGR02556 family CRISPR-associated protein n=1 Tax=Caloramator sp. E03 TaxID=2576307 RepID=UPI001110F285|nr:TIGR02556 family CRISPR-associated protein [Caloramator sp. E03]QCX34102.1 TIGR02556 family CRISPR-associated protein [Caloramator sp. E03]